MRQSPKKEHDASGGEETCLPAAVLSYADKKVPKEPA